MYYKILDNNNIIDVLVNPNFVALKRNGTFKKVALDQAQGIQSSSGTTIWHMEGFPALPKWYKTVRVIEITNAEYEALIEAWSTKEEISIETSQVEMVVVPAEKITIEAIKEARIKLLNQSCAEAIVKGISVRLSDGLMHYFSLTIEDQINLLNLQELINNGAESVLYHENGQPCKIYSAIDMKTILQEASRHKIYHTTYFNALKSYINQLNDIGLIRVIHYGAEIPEEYQTEALKSLLK